MSASLIIPTYKREQSLVDCLESSFRQDYQPLEIALIDQTESHTSAVERFLRDNETRFRWIRHSTPSAVTARNRGIAATTGEVLIFIDDDTTFSSDFVTHHINAHQRGADVVQGRVIEPGRGVSYRSQWMLPWLRVVGSNTYDKSGKTNTLTGCNFSISRRAVKTIGEFDTLFTGAAIREDADFGIRCFRAGLTMVFDADACLTHHRDAVGGVDADVTTTSRIFHPDVMRNELYFARKHFNSLVVWQYKKRIMRRLKRAQLEHSVSIDAKKFISDADIAAIALIKRNKLLK